jgi:hypothetical protein
LAQEDRYGLSQCSDDFRFGCGFGRNDRLWLDELNIESRSSVDDFDSREC